MGMAGTCVHFAPALLRRAAQWPNPVLSAWGLRCGVVRSAAQIASNLNDAIGSFGVISHCNVIDRTRGSCA